MNAIGNTGKSIKNAIFFSKFVRVTHSHMNSHRSPFNIYICIFSHSPSEILLNKKVSTSKKSF